MNLWKDLEAWDHDSNGAGITTLRVLVEIPIGSLLKYEYHPDGYMTIVREMHHKYPYPYNYGCICGTLGGDNDPLDAIILYDKEIQPGTVLNCKIIGVVTTEDYGEVDDKILVIPYFSHPSKINIKKVLKYLNTYKYPDNENTFIKQVFGPKKARELVQAAIKAFKENIK